MKCYYAECHYAECRDLSIVMLDAIMLNVIMLSAMAPFQVYCLRVLPEPQSQTLDSAGKTYQEQTLAYFPLCELRKNYNMCASYYKK
jgi:hypothetical protein